jgi:hypothetical protein
MKKVISSYNNVNLDFREYYIIYKKTHRNFVFWLKYRKKEKYPFTDAQKILLKKIENKKSILIDSFGYLFNKSNKNSICFENKNYKKIFDKILNSNKKIYTTSNFFSNTMVHIIKRESPRYLVFFYADILRYHSLDSLAEFINDIKKKLKNINLLFFIDITFINFNKIKYSNSDAIETLKNKINFVFSYKKISEFDYLMEID